MVCLARHWCRCTRDWRHRGVHQRPQRNSATTSRLKLYAIRRRRDQLITSAPIGIIAIPIGTISGANDDPVSGKVGTRAINVNPLPSYVAPLAPTTMLVRRDCARTRYLPVGTRIFGLKRGTYAVRVRASNTAGISPVTPHRVLRVR
jgi:hypothetical protein